MTGFIKIESDGDNSMKLTSMTKDVSVIDKAQVLHAVLSAFDISVSEDIEMVAVLCAIAADADKKCRIEKYEINKDFLGGHQDDCGDMES